MYTAQLTIERIQRLIKEKELTQKEVLFECGIGKDTLKRMTDNKGISSFSLAKIADYLECSVDYLLGRTDNPKIISNSGNNINQQNIGGDATASIANKTKKSADSISEKFMQIFNNLPFEEQLAVMNIAVEKSKKYKE